MQVGAAPRAAGARVFVGDGGEVYGTIGGGCVEAEVWQEARGVLRRQEPKRPRYAMNGKTVEDEGMICGGMVELFLEPVTAKHKDITRRYSIASVDTNKNVHKHRSR